MAGKKANMRSYEKPLLFLELGLLFIAASGDSPTLIPLIYETVPIWEIGHSKGAPVTLH